MTVWSDFRVVSGWVAIAAVVVALSGFICLTIVQVSPQSTLKTCVRSHQWAPEQCRRLVR